MSLVVQLASLSSYARHRWIERLIIIFNAGHASLFVIAFHVRYPTTDYVRWVMKLGNKVESGLTFPHVLCFCSVRHSPYF